MTMTGTPNGIMRRRRPSWVRRPHWLRVAAALVMFGLLFTAVESFLPDVHEEGGVAVTAAVTSETTPSSFAHPTGTAPADDGHAMHVDHCEHAHSAPPAMAALVASWVGTAAPVVTTAPPTTARSADHLPEVRPPIA